MRKAPLYEVRYIDAWVDDMEGGWTWNQSFKLFEFRSNASDMKRTFTRKLRECFRKGVRTFLGVSHPELGKGWYCIDGNYDLMELCARKDGCPLYACIRMTP